MQPGKVILFIVEFALVNHALGCIFSGTATLFDWGVMQGACTDILAALIDYAIRKAKDKKCHEEHTIF